MPDAAGVMRYPASAAWVRWAEQWEVPMETNVRIVGKTNLAIVLLLTVTYLFCVIGFGVGGTVISILTILGIHDAVSDAPYWVDLSFALFVGTMGVALIKVMWRYPFVFRSKSIEGFHKIRTIEDRDGRPVFPMIEFYDGSMVGLGDAYRRNSREAELLAAIIKAFSDWEDA